MTRKQKQRLSEIRQGAKQGAREGYRTPGGMNYTLARGDVVELLRHIDHLESWVKDEAERHNRRGLFPAFFAPAHCRRRRASQK